MNPMVAERFRSVEQRPKLRLRRGHALARRAFFEQLLHQECAHWGPSDKTDE